MAIKKPTQRHFLSSQHQVSVAYEKIEIDKETGAWSNNFPVPEDSTKSVEWHFVFPDGTRYTVSLSLSSEQNWHDVIESAEELQQYIPSDYKLSRSGNDLGATSTPQSFSLGTIMPNDIRVGFTIPAGHHMIVHDMIVHDVDVAVEGDLLAYD